MWVLGGPVHLDSPDWSWCLPQGHLPSHRPPWARDGQPPPSCRATPYLGQPWSWPWSRALCSSVFCVSFAFCLFSIIVSQVQHPCCQTCPSSLSSSEERCHKIRKKWKGWKLKKWKHDFTHNDKVLVVLSLSSLYQCIHGCLWQIPASQCWWCWAVVWWCTSPRSRPTDRPCTGAHPAPASCTAGTRGGNEISW